MTRRIGLDCDGVIADFAGCALERINDELGTTFSLDQWTSWDPAECFGDLGPAIWGVIRAMSAEGDWIDECLPLPGAVDCVARLAERFEVHVITSIREEHLERRVAWMFRHGFRVWQIHVCYDKAPLIAEMGLLAFADDKHTTVNSVAERTEARSYLIDAHSNRGVPLVPAARRVTLGQFTDIFTGRVPA